MKLITLGDRKNVSILGISLLLIMVGITPFVLSNSATAGSSNISQFPLLPGNLYGVTGGDGDSDFYRLLPEDCLGCGVSYIAFLNNGFSGLAFDSDGTLYAAGAANGGSETFGILDTVDGAYAEISSTFGCTDITIDPTDGALYCQEHSDLYSVDKTTGVRSLIGSNGVGSNGNAIAISPSGIMYFGNEVGLYTLDKTNGQGTPVSEWNGYYPGGFGDCRTNALDFDSSGILWGSLRCSGESPAGSYLVTIDTDIAEMTLIDSTVNKLDGIAFVPETVPHTHVSDVIFLGYTDHKTKGLAFVPGEAEDVLYSISPNDYFLRQIDPVTAETILEIPLVYDSCGDSCEESIDRGNGLAYDENSGTLWAIVNACILSSDEGCGRYLAIIDPSIIPEDGESGWNDTNLTLVGVLPDRFAGLAVNPTLGLLGITGDGAADPATLFSIDIPETPDAETIIDTGLLVTLGNGDDGEAIAFNTSNDLLYHASGRNNVIFETVDLNNDNMITPIIISDTELINDEVQALTYWPSENVIYWAEYEYVNDCDNCDDALYRVEIVDTAPPQAIDFSANIDVISEFDVGGELRVTVDYDEVMDITTTPTLRFELPLEPSTDPTTTTITPTGGEWDCESSRGICTSYTATYGIADGNVEVSTVNITTIPSARDSAGNLEDSAFYVNIFGIDTLSPQGFSKAITGLHEITIVYHEPAHGSIFDYTQYIDPESPIIDGTHRGITDLSGDDDCSPTHRFAEIAEACATHVITFDGPPANSDSTGSIVINGIHLSTIEDEYGNEVPTSSIPLKSPRITFDGELKPGVQSNLLIKDDDAINRVDSIIATIVSVGNTTPVEVELLKVDGASGGDHFSALIQFTKNPLLPDDDTTYFQLNPEGDVVTVTYRTFEKEFTSSPKSINPGNFGGQSTNPADIIRFFESDAYFVGSTATLRISDASVTEDVIPGIVIESSTGDTFTVDANRILPGSPIFATGSVTLVSENNSDPPSPDVLVSDVDTTISSTYRGFTTEAGVIANPDVEFLFAPDTTKVETCLAGDPNTGVDTDFDGICDKWEHPDIDVALRIPTGDPLVFYELSCVEDATLDSDPTGATVCPVVGIPDSYVEVDYMERHEPEPVAINDVVKSFDKGLVRDENGATIGVLTHIFVDNQVQHVDLLPFADITDDTATTFLTLKRANFGTELERNPGCDLATQECIDEIERTLTAKRQVFRYGMFTHEQAGNVGSSGYAERPGNDFIVSLGSFDGFRGTVGQQSGTLMHEMGHTLGLRHGGPDDINCKPNYPSVMNYLYQFDGADGGLLNERPLDFSPSAYTTIDEASLSDNSKIIGSATRTMVIGGIDSDGNPLSTFEGDAGTSGSRRSAGTADQINWDRTSTVVTGLSQNVHYFENIPGCQDEIIYGTAEDESFTGLRSQDDWGSIAFNFRVFDSFDSGAINKKGSDTPLLKGKTTVNQALEELKVLVNVKLDGKDAEKLTKKLDKVILSLNPSADSEKIFEKLLKETKKFHDKGNISDIDNTLLVAAIGSGDADNINDAIDNITALSEKDIKKLIKEVDKLGGSPDFGKACKELDGFIKDVDKNKTLSSVEKTELKNAASAIKVLLPC